MSRASWAASIVVLALTAAPGRADGRSAPGADADVAIRAAFDSAYNLDEGAALEQARRAVALAPDESRTHRTLASILWLQILFARGAVTVDTYLGGVTKAQLNLPKPPPALDAEFKAELARAIDLSDAALKGNPHDLNARHDLGTAYGLQASYAASVEGSTTSAFSSARHAYDAEEAVLDADPSRIAAGVIVGTYRYLVSSLALPARMFAYLAGFGGGKERGIALVAAATRDPESHVEATTALVLIYSREGRDLDAARLLGELAAEFPRNRLFVLEQASALIRGGHSGEAEPLLTKGLQALGRDDRPKLTGERALWLYKRGIAGIVTHRLPAAETDLQTALTNDPVPWVKGRIELDLGKIADLTGQRDAAVAKYHEAQGISQATNDPLCTDEAGRLLKHPFTLN